MPQLADRDRIRSILELDRTWAAYALADLEPDAFRHIHNGIWSATIGPLRWRNPPLLNISTCERQEI